MLIISLSMDTLENEIYNNSIVDSRTELQQSSHLDSSPNLLKENLTKSECCSDLDEFCNLVEIRQGRSIGVCYIPSSVKLGPSTSGCNHIDSPKNNNNIKQNTDIPLNYSINFAADTSPELIRKKDFDSSRPCSSLKNDIIDQTAIFFLHGVGGELKVWSPQIKYFNNLGFTVVAVDFIGHGSSSSPSDESAYHFDEMNLDVLAVFDKYSSHMNVLVGHSYGCSFAAAVARSRSTLVHGLIMISGGGPFPLGPQTGIFCLPLFVLNCLSPCILIGFLNRSFHRPGRLNACKRVAVKVPMHVLKNTLKGQKWDAGDAAYYGCIACRTLLIHARHDRLISSSEVLLMNQTIQGSQLAFVEDCGHMVMLEAPDETNSIVWEFLSQNLSGFNSAFRCNSQLKSKLAGTESNV